MLMRLYMKLTYVIFNEGNFNDVKQRKIPRICETGGKPKGEILDLIIQVSRIPYSNSTDSILSQWMILTRQIGIISYDPLSFFV